MRQIHLDLTTGAPPNGSTTFLGIAGEHNATDLCIAVDADMLQNADYFVVVFRADNRNR